MSQPPPRPLYNIQPRLARVAYLASNLSLHALAQYCKRASAWSLVVVQGAVSVTLMSCSLIGCAAAIVLTTWSIVKDADRLRVTVAAVQDSRTSTSFPVEGSVLRNDAVFPWAAPRILRWGVQNRIRERSERKKNFCTPIFPNVGGTSKQISVGAY